MKQLWKKSSRTLRMEQLENRELLSATTWNNAIDADAAVAAEMSEVLSAATTDAIDLSKVTTNLDVVDATDGVISLREALDYVATGQAVDANGALINTITFASGLSGETITLTQGELQFTNKMLTHGEEARVITIDASNLEGGVTISGNEKFRVFNVFATENADAFTPAFMNLTIADGNVEGNGAAINADGYNLTLTNCEFIGNYATGAGGAVYGKNTTITDSTFTNNEAGGAGGAVYGAAMTIVDSTFTDNEAGGAGGAVYGATTIAGSTFTSNTADGAGGAVYGAVSKIAGSTFTSNTAGGAGGAVLSNYSVYTGVSIENSNFDSNQATGDGGAVSLLKVAKVTSSTFSNNSASANGGALYTGGASHLTSTFTASTFENNTAGKDGGGFYATSRATVNGVALEDGTTTKSIFANNVAGGLGGGFYLASKGTVTDAVFSANKAKSGGGFYSVGSIADLTVAKSTFTKNEANGTANRDKYYTGSTEVAGCGAGFFFGGQGATLSVSGSTFDGNVANSYGGGMYVGRSTSGGSVLDSSFIGNETGFDGGAIWAGRAVALTNLLIADNTAGDKGSAAVVRENGSATMTNCTVVNNVSLNAEGRDGAAYFGQHTQSFDNSIFVGNKNAAGVASDVICGLGFYADGTPFASQSANGNNVLSEASTNWSSSSQNVIAYDATKPLFTNAENGDYTLAYNSQALGVDGDLGAFESSYVALAFPTITVSTPVFDAATLTYAATVTVENVDLNATDYAFQYKLADADQWIDADATSKDGAITITGLAPNKSYDFRARALGDEYKEGEEVKLVYASTDWSESETATTDKAQMNLPNLDAMISATATTITIDFSKDTNAGQGDSYILLYQKVGDAGWKYEFVNRGENGFGTITWDNLDINAKYNVMAGVNASGDYISSLISNAQEFSTTKYQLAAPTIESVVVGESQAANNATVTVTVGKVDDAPNKEYSLQYATAVVNEETGEVVYDWQDAKAQTDENGAFVVSGLNAATTYYFRAIASADADLYDSAYGAASEGYKTKQVVLGVPEYTLEAVGHDKVKVTITNYDPNTSQFKLYLATTASTINSTTKLLDKGVTEYTFEGLNPNQTYYVTVMALGEGVYTNKQSSAQAVTTEREQLAAPENLAVTAKDQTSISVSFDAVKNTADYIIEYSVAGKNEWIGVCYHDFDARGKVNWTFSGLEAGTDYDVRVTALGFGDYLDSEAASLVDSTTQYDLVAPSLKLIGMTQATSKDGATITVELTGDDNATGYLFQYKAVGDEGWTTVSDAKVGNITVAAEPNREYVFQVQALGSKAYKDSAVVEVTGIKTEKGVLDFPTITVGAATSTTVDINVGSVDKAESYVVEYAPYTLNDAGEKVYDLDYAGTFVATVGDNTIENLRPNKTYDFRAYAKADDYNNSAWSEEKTAATSVYVFGAPKFTLTPYTYIGEDGNEDYGFTVNVTEDAEAKNAGVRYYYQYREIGGQWSAVKSTPESSFSISGLEYGKEYQVSVQAITAADDYESSTRSTVTAFTASKVLDAPEVKATTVDSSTVNLEITPVDNAYGYRIQYVNGGETITVNLVKGETSYDVEGLDPNKTYEFSVYSLGTDRYADSEEAFTVSATTDKGQLLLSDKNVKVTATQTTVTVDVDVDAKYGDTYGSFLINYRAGDGSWTYKTVKNFDNPVTFDVAPGQNYEVTVEAYVADLSGDYIDSNIYSVTGTAPKLAMEGVPTFTVEDVTGSTIVVSVDGVKEAVGYEVEYTTDGENWYPLVEEGGFYTVDGLDEQETVYFRAVAKGGEHYSDVATEENFEATTTYAAADSFQFTQTINKTGVQSVKVVWADNTEYETGYMVQYKVADGDWQDLATVGQDVANVQFAEKDGFVGGSVYTFRVGAMIGEDVVWSEETVFESYGAPTVEIASKTETTFTIALAENATRMRVEVLDTPFTSEATLSSSKLIRCVTLKEGVASWTATKLTAGATYYVRVRAVDGASNSAWTYLEVTLPTTEPTPEEVVSEAFADFFAEETEDDFWFEFEKAVGARK